MGDEGGSWQTSTEDRIWCQANTKAGCEREEERAGHQAARPSAQSEAAESGNGSQIVSAEGQSRAKAAKDAAAQLETARKEVRKRQKLERDAKTNEKKKKDSLRKARELSFKDKARARADKMRAVAKADRDKLNAE